MLQLFINDIPSDIFFEKDTTLKDIYIWVYFKVGTEKGNLLFSLSEPYSCSTSIDEERKHIHISGDEDSKYITVEEVTPVKLWED